MAASERTRDRGARQARRVQQEIARELRDARLIAGLSQRAVAHGAGTSQSRVSRIERAVQTPAGIAELAGVCSALGLRLSVKMYPEGVHVRDAAQLRLLGRFRVRVCPPFGWGSEVPVAGFGDLRAWDARLDGPGSVGVDAETRLYDIQAVQRRIETKARDSDVDRIVMLVARTQHNMAILRVHRASLLSTFPADTRDVMAALRRGELPERNGIVLL